MGPLNATIIFFLLSLSLGIGIFTPLASTRMTGAGLFKVMQQISLVALLFVAVTVFLAGSGTYSISLVFGLGVALASMVFTLLFHQDEKSKFMWLFYLLQNISLILMVVSYSNLESLPMLHLALGGLLLGIITYAMVLGHWYLVTPKLSEKPLLKSLWIVWMVLLAKLILLPNLYLDQTQYYSPGSMLAMGSMMNWVFLAMRVLWGYITIVALSYFAWRLVRMRSIQSATGVLYVMTFFVFAGELISAYIYFKYGLYL